MNLKKVKITIKGITPLLMNAPTPDICVGVPDKEKEKWAKMPEEKKIHAKVHKDEKGNPCIPSTMIKACLINAGSGLSVKDFLMKAGKPGKSINKNLQYKGIFKKHLRINPVNVPVNSNKYEIYGCPGQNVNTGAMVWVQRPMFKNWGCTFEIQYDADLITKEALKKALHTAGFAYGLGSSRPENGGEFGQFEVVKFQ